MMGIRGPRPTTAARATPGARATFGVKPIAGTRHTPGTMVTPGARDTRGRKATPGANRCLGGARAPRPPPACSPRPLSRGCPISDMRARRQWLLTVAVLSSALVVATGQAAEAPPLVLEHLTPSEGLPQGTVYDSLQDSQGFVWLATEDGLIRYDGLELYRYAYSRTAREGLPGNFIREIVEDAHHDLWIAIKDAGLARWNRATDSFTRFRHDPNDP